MLRSLSLSPLALFAAAAITAAAAAACGSGHDPPPEKVGAPAAASVGEPVAPAPIVGDAACAAKNAPLFERIDASDESASVELVRERGKADAPLMVWVADGDGHALHAFAGDPLEEVGVTEIDGVPGHVRALADGRLVVTLRDKAQLLVLEPTDATLSSFEKRCAIDLPAEPWGIAESGDAVLVTSGFGAELTVLRKSDMAKVRSVPLPREPRAVVLDSEGKTAFVSHAVGGLLSVVDLASPDKAPERIDLRSGRRFKTPQGDLDEHPREADQGYSLTRVLEPGQAAEGFRLVVPQASVDPGVIGTAQSGGYGGASVRAIASLVSSVDPNRKKLITTSAAMTRVGNARDCLLPRSAVSTGSALFVACLDADAVVELDPWLSDPSLGERHRFAMPRGPSGIALDRSRGSDAASARLFVWSELDRALSSIDMRALAPATAPKSTPPKPAAEAGVPGVTSVLAWRRAAEKIDPVLERGRRLFTTTTDARLSAGRACASCHPEGRDDGLVWSTPDGARQTPTLAGKLEGTEPYGWFGESGDMHEHLVKTFFRIGGTGLGDPAGQPSTTHGDADKADFDALIAYASSLRLPARAASDHVDLAVRGKQVFVATGCAGCHVDGGTDKKAHDVGSGVKDERQVAFDTPSLAGVGETAPYFHDGRYTSLADMLTDRTMKMFDVASLGDDDRRALLAYLETL